MLYAFAFLATNVFCRVLVLPESVTETQVHPDMRGRRQMTVRRMLLGHVHAGLLMPFPSGPSCVDSRELH